MAPERPLVAEGRPVGDLVQGPAESVDARATLRQVISRLGELGIGLVVVCENDAVVGVISERDVVWALSQGALVDEIWAADVMTVEPLSVAPSTPVADAARLMTEKRLRHLLVSIGPQPGVVSLRDVVEVLLD